MKKLLIYGATGYRGRMAVRHAGLFGNGFAQTIADTRVTDVEAA